MDVKEYISSGILESYALGLISSQEKQEVECLSKIYPEINSELVKIMVDMEEVARLQKIDPPAALKQKLFTELKTTIAEGKLQKDASKMDNEAKIIPLQTNVSSGGGSMFKLLAAACFVGVVVLGILYFNQRSEVSEMSSQLAQTNKEKETLSNAMDTEIAEMRQSNEYTEKELAMFRNPDFKTVFLKNTPNKPENSLAIICWNTKSKEVMVAVEDLPEAPADKQYQLWAIVDGKPMDMGMINKDSTNKGFQLVKTVEQPQAFAITLENEGGSPTPTMENMYVIGTI